MVTIEKDDFLKIMRHIKEQLDKDDKLTELLVHDDCSGWISTSAYLIDDLIYLMSSILEDKDEWISWWLWEADERRNDNAIWTEYEGESYKFIINDEEDLYYLIKNDLSSIKEKVKEEPPRGNLYESSDINNCNENNEIFYNDIISQIFKFTESNN